MKYAGANIDEATVRAKHVLNQVGLSDRMSHGPTELSGGQQQRVAVARAIVHRPSVILCDEPTGNLDSKTSAEVLTLLKRLNSEQDTTFLIVTHDANIAALCDRVIQMEDGLIINPNAQHEEE